jgi:hypothetical protein
MMNETYTYKVCSIDNATDENCRWSCDLYTVDPDTFQLNYFTCKIFRGKNAALDASNYGADFCQRLNNKA